ncbi:MAG: hypothetical protein JWN00_2280 [Actinomycetia bacterium]|nr:hypothetical protein [Actinomycetes bacterium]
MARLTDDLSEHHAAALKLRPYELVLIIAGCVIFLGTIGLTTLAHGMAIAGSVLLGLAGLALVVVELGRARTAAKHRVEYARSTAIAEVAEAVRQHDELLSAWDHTAAEGMAELRDFLAGLRSDVPTRPYER